MSYSGRDNNIFLKRNMNKMKIKYHFIFLALTMSLSLIAREKHTDVTELKMNVSSYDQILLFNKYGDVKVTGISGNTAIVKVRRTLDAKSRKQLDEAKNEIYLDTMQLEDNLYFFIQNPYQILEIDKVGGNAYYNSRDQGKWRWSNHSDDRVRYEFTFEVQLPMNMDFRVSTHKKDLLVKNMKGRLNASAHHGHITLEGVTDLESANGHHGDIHVSFSQNPRVDSKFHTHHGNIELEFPSAPSADISMKSHHGKFFTDFDWQPVAQKISKEKNKRGMTYKIGASTSVRMGRGDYKISMRSHHGDMYIKRA